MGPYLEMAFDTIIAHGGKLIVRTNNIDVREATHGPCWNPSRILIIEFGRMAPYHAPPIALSKPPLTTTRFPSPGARASLKPQQT